MNPEAGLIQGKFRSEVERIARANPLLPADEVLRRARGEAPMQVVEVRPEPARAMVETATEV